jgi:heme a synthase
VQLSLRNDRLRRDRLPTIGPRAFLRLAQINLGLVVLNIVSGAAVRLTDSGLGCPDWPNCSQHHFTPALSFHPAVEFGNRLVVVALTIAAALALVCSWRRTPRRKDLMELSGGLVAGIVGEALLGAIVVYSKLNPYAVMCHFLMGLVLLTVALALAFRAGRAPERGALKVSNASLAASRVCFAILALAIAAGTATTGSGPHAGGPGAKRIPVPLADMARTHSGIVLILAACVLGLLYLLERSGAPESVRVRGRILLGAMVVQGLIGYTQYFTHLPAALVGVHVFGATVVWSAMYWFADGLRHHAPEAAVAPVGVAVEAVAATPAAMPAADSASAHGTPVTASIPSPADAATPVESASPSSTTTIPTSVALSNKGIGR